MPREKLSRADFREVIEQETERLQQVNQSRGTICVHVSGGSASALTAIRSQERWGGRVSFVFADTCSEDADTYRFLDDLEQYLGPIERLRQFNADGSPTDIWDCFDAHGIMRIAKAGNACKASVELKQKPLDAHTRAHGHEWIAIGYNWDEPERVVKLQSKRPEAVFPLVGTEPRLTECQIHEELRRIGLEPPRVYAQGFVHNNCLGAGGCILAGLSQWAAVRELKPDAFAYAKDREAAFADRTGFTVLRDQRGGETKSYTLAELEEDAKAGRDFGRQWKSTCGCMEQQQLFTPDELLCM